MSNLTERNHQPHDQTIPQSPSSGFRGLPAPSDLLALAKTYLQEQHMHWPLLANTDALPPNDDESAEAMARSYEVSYRACQSCPFSGHSVRMNGIGIGAAYIRYSDANSNASSLNQQLINALRSSKKANAFIPWAHVYGDAAIPGTTTDRNGYRMLRAQVLATSKTFDFVFVDDLDRLNRDQLESHAFIRLLADTSKRLVATDGFDSADRSAKITHSFKAMQNDFFNDQLKDKVNRGMEYAFSQGRNLGLPPLGYKTVPKRDADGNLIMNRHKKYVTEVVIDDDAAELVRRIFKMYVEQKMSSLQISRLLNAESAGGTTHWTSSRVMCLLRNERFIGVYVWRVRKGVKNPVTGKRKDTMRPASEHLRQECPHLRIIPDDLWQAAQKRRVAARRGKGLDGKPTHSRQALYPTRLFDLYCRDCDRPLLLARAGKYSHLGCVHGKEGNPRCGLRHSKMLGIVDHCILENLRLHFLNQSKMEEMLEQANAYLLVQAAMPTADTVQLEKDIKRETDRIKRLVDQVANLDAGHGADLLMKKVSESQATLANLESELNMAKAGNFRPEPIDAASFATLLGNLRDLLLDDVVASSDVLAKALGRVYVTQGPKRGAFYSWIAELSINEVPVLLEIAKRSNCPGLDSLDFLQIRSWTSRSSLTVELDQRKRCGVVDAESSEFLTVSGDRG